VRFYATVTVKLTIYDSLCDTRINSGIHRVSSVLRTAVRGNISGLGTSLNVTRRDTVAFQSRLAFVCCSCWAQKKKFNGTKDCLLEGEKPTNSILLQGRALNPAKGRHVHFPPQYDRSPLYNEKRQTPAHSASIPESLSDTLLLETPMRKVHYP
jgi:hypothetical protein